MIPCRDAAGHLRPLLESLLAQSEPAVRIALIDDASQDGSVALAREVAGARVDVHENPSALGIGGNWNRCAELVDTPYFCIAHQDDVYEPRFVERMCDELDANPGAGMVHCRAAAIDGDGRPHSSPAERYKEHFWRAGHGDGRAEQYARLWSGNYICCPSVVYRTAAFRQAGPFRVDLQFALDWEYWFRMLRGGHDIAELGEVLLQYRRHPTAATRAATSEQWRFAEELAVLAEARAEGVACGLLTDEAAVSPALRNNLLHESLIDLQRGDHGAMRRKLEFVRKREPRLWGDPYVRAFRLLRRLGPPGRWLLTAGRDMAVRFGFGGAV
ncbi:MAG: glycosyltransferase family 2 protein [Planctomycetota bacterium]